MRHPIRLVTYIYSGLIGGSKKWHQGHISHHAVSPRDHEVQRKLYLAGRGQNFAVVIEQHRLPDQDWTNGSRWWFQLPNGKAYASRTPPQGWVQWMHENYGLTMEVADS